MSANEYLEEAAYQHIKNKIVRREIFPGSRILQEKIVQETGISRTPVYQAILRLKHEGYVDLLPKRGATVVNPTAKEILDVFEFRIFIETDLVRRVCPIISDECLDEIEYYANEQERLYTTHDIQTFNDLNRKFHTTLCKESNNMYYEKFLQELFNKTDIFLLFYDRYIMLSPEESATLREHKQIMSALRARDTDACVRYVREHIETTRKHLDIFMPMKNSPEPQIK
ncbi:MAG: GntR family transcriptional regulator [Clostridiales bacterium]|nr:GntR family transcriptional regulator [Clostridiales bacterium]